MALVLFAVLLSATADVSPTGARAQSGRGGPTRVHAVPPGAATPFRGLPRVEEKILSERGSEQMKVRPSTLPLFPYPLVLEVCHVAST